MSGADGGSADGRRTPDQPSLPSPPEACWVCGGLETEWRRCKLVCLGCGTILMSCEDL